MKTIKVVQSDIDMENFPLKSPKELSILCEFPNLCEISLEFPYHSFDNYHKEFQLLNSALNTLRNLKKLKLVLINRFAECVDDANFLYFYDTEAEVEIRELVNWKGIKDETLEILLYKTFEKCEKLEEVSMNFSFNAISPEGIEKLLEKIAKLKDLKEVVLDFSKQKELNVKKGEKLVRKKLAKCFTKITTEKNMGFFFFNKKTLKDIANKLLGEKIKGFVL